MSYALSNGLVIPDFDHDDIDVALGVLRWYGGDITGGPYTAEDLLARALASALNNRQVREAEERRIERWHEQSAYQLKVDQQVRESRERARTWFREVHDEEVPRG